MKNILIVVDMQNDFIDGALGSKEALSIVPIVLDKLKTAKKDNDIIVLTMDTHSSDYLTTPEGCKLPVEHCIKGTQGHALNKDIDAELTPDMIVVEKGSFACTELPELIKPLLGCETAIELCGLCTDICVVSNALLLKAYYPENQIIVDPAAGAGSSREGHEAALKTMRACHIDIINQEKCAACSHGLN